MSYFLRISALGLEENALRAFLWQRYQGHKHRDHILASFLAMRRRRLYARLQAARSALEIAKELLTPDDTILRDLLRVLHQPEEPRAGKPVLAEEAQESQSDEQPTPITDRHIYGD